MLYRILTLSGVVLTLALPAAAQQTAQSNQSSNSNAGQNQQQSGAHSMNIRQTITQELEKAGYTNVKVAPASFVAEAKDKQGRPVTMVINPDSVTTVTALSDQSKQAPDQSNTGNSSNGNGSPSKQ